MPGYTGTVTLVLPKHSVTGRNRLTHYLFDSERVRAFTHVDTGMIGGELDKVHGWMDGYWKAGFKCVAVAHL